MSEEHLVLHVPGRPMLVAGRLRMHMEKRGFVTLPTGAPVPAFGFTLVIRRDGPGACWIHSDVTDAIPHELGQLLSQDLHCRVTTLGRAGEIIAYEAAESGAIVEKLAVKGAKILDAKSSPLQPEVEAGQPLEALLLARGLDGLNISFDEARQTRRALVVSFAGRSGASAETIEIDPLLECPLCQSAMRRVDGRHGTFYGCVRFPECRGRLTQKQAEAQRA